MAGATMMLRLFAISLSLDEMVNFHQPSELAIHSNLTLISTLIGALALLKVPEFNSSSGFRDIVIDEVSCHSNEAKLLNCHHFRRGYFCRYGGGAGVRCREEVLRVKSVSAATVDTPYCTKRTVMISWKLHNDSSHTHQVHLQSHALINNITQNCR